MQLINDYVILAKDVSTDSNDNMVSILKVVDNFEMGVSSDMYDQMEAGDGKIFNGPLQFAIATSFTSENKATKDLPFELKVEIVSPSDKTLWEFKQEFFLKKNTDRARINLNIQGMPISGSGRYKVRASAFDGEKMLSEGSSYLNVIISKNPQ